MNAVNAKISKPPILGGNTLRVVPLGGLGDVGRNMTAIELIDPIDGGEPKILLVDCGVLFPGDNEPGVDQILPDFSYISERLDRVEALVVTHGHEDHIGAIPYLLELRPDTPIVGSKFTLELIRRRTADNGAFYEVNENSEVRYGPFLLQFIAINHSIPDALAVFIKTAAGNILNTGDFKMDQLPIDGRLTDLRALADVGRAGVDLFMVDSTNAMVPGFVTSEAQIEAKLDEIVDKVTDGCIFVSTFASHIHRVSHIFKIARKHRRKVILLGRTMVNNIAIAAKLGLLDDATDVLVEEKNFSKVNRNKLIVVCTGSQGELHAVLNRLSMREYPSIGINSGDTVVLASSLTPGKEKEVTKLINRILTLGATVISSKTARVHCSGHANQGELRIVYNVVRPKNVLPIHGEVQHLLANAAVAHSCRIPRENIAVVKDGGVIDVHNGQARVVGRIENGYIFVDGKSVGEVSDGHLKQRKTLGQEGFIAITVTVDLVSREVVTTPKISVIAVAEDLSVFAKLPNKIKKELVTTMEENHNVTAQKLTKIVRQTVGHYVERVLKRSPMILPLVSTVNRLFDSVEE